MPFDCTSSCSLLFSYFHYRICVILPEVLRYFDADHEANIFCLYFFVFIKFILLNDHIDMNANTIIKRQSVIMKCVVARQTRTSISLGPYVGIFALNRIPTSGSL